MIARRRSYCRVVYLTGFLLAGPVIGAYAQTVTDPRTAEFDPSPDHNTTAPDGTPLVTRYDLQFFFAGAPQPFLTGSLGKPAPQSDGKIRVDLASAFVALPPPGVLYEARVAAVGPGGSAVSDVSNQFVFGTLCTYAISPTSASPNATATTGSIAVTAGAGCSWTAGGGSSWLTVTSGSSGAGNGTVGYSVAANTSANPRTGTLTIAGMTFTVTQAGLSCSFTIAPTSRSLSAAGGTGSVTVTTQTGCSWTATSHVGWITVTNSTGSGTGTFSYNAGVNSSASSRTGTVTVAGQTFTVTETGLSAPIPPTGLRIVRQ